MGIADPDNPSAPPTVTVVVAARNEERHIGALLDSLEAQTYPADRFELVLADGGSTDRTADIVQEWSATHSLTVRLIDNPGRVTASGLNAGIETSEAEVVIILGAHAAVPVDFVAASVEVLVDSGAACAGGLLETIGRGSFGEVVAVATTSPFGVGNATFRTGGGGAADVDTVAFGAYRREVFDEIGGFDVSLVGAEDDEFNFRLERSGGRIRFDPRIRATYYCRDSVKGLARQYFMYGRGKTWVLRKHKRPPSARMLVPGVLVVGLTGGLVVSLVRRQWWWAGLAFGGYASGIGAVAAKLGRERRVPASTLAVALGTIHVSYGVGLVVGAVRPAPSSGD